jgi:hypothetical protein
MLGILLANRDPRGRQITKLGTLAGGSGRLPMGSSHVVLIDFLVARSTGFGAYKSNSTADISVNNVFLSFCDRFG